jgi:hypothetical protein
LSTSVRSIPLSRAMSFRTEKQVATKRFGFRRLLFLLCGVPWFGSDVYPSSAMYYTVTNAITLLQLQSERNSLSLSRLATSSSFNKASLIITETFAMLFFLLMIGKVPSSFGDAVFSLESKSPTAKASGSLCSVTESTTSSSY